jgi:D-aminopeptidase
VFFNRVLKTLPLKITYFAEGTFRENENYRSNIYSAEVTVKSNAIYGARIYINFEGEDKGEITYTIGDKVIPVKFVTGDWMHSAEIDFKITALNSSEIKNQQSAVKGNSLYFVVNNIEGLANQYFSRLNVKLLSDAAKTIEITFQDNNAAKTTDVVAAMANEFIEYDKEKKGESAQKILSFLDDQLLFMTG